MNQSKSSSQNHVVVLVSAQQAAVFSRHAQGQWSIRRIKGETLTPLKHNKPDTLSSLLQELSGQFNDEQGLKDVQVDFLYTQDGGDAVLEVPASLAKLHCRAWQILRLEPLIERASRQQSAPRDWSLTRLQEADSADTLWIRDVLLPATEPSLGLLPEPVEEEEASPVQAEAPSASGASGKEKATRLRALEQQNQMLKTQLAYAGPLDGEALLTFLPALYQKAFTVLNGADLAALLGRVQPFNIPSPYPEMSGDALNKKQRDFRALPREEQRRVVAFAQDASQRLQPRKEMLDLIREIEDDA